MFVSVLRFVVFCTFTNAFYCCFNSWHWSSLVEMAVGCLIAMTFKCSSCCSRCILSVYPNFLIWKTPLLMFSSECPYVDAFISFCYCCTCTFCWAYPLILMCLCCLELYNYLMICILGALHHSYSSYYIFYRIWLNVQMLLVFNIIVAYDLLLMCIFIYV